MIALLLAAGEGRRLRPYTEVRPKCLVELAGKPLLRWQLDALSRAGVDRIVLVTGYLSSQFENLGLETCHNPRFSDTNMVASSMCARAYLDGSHDILLVYTDIVYEHHIISSLISSPCGFATTVDYDWRSLWDIRMEDPLSDAESLSIGPTGDIVSIGDKPGNYGEIMAQYMGITKIRKDCIQSFANAFDQLGDSAETISMTSFLQRLIIRGTHVCSVAVRRGWLEVDTASDLDRYNQMWKEGTLAPFWNGQY
jgi:choline kinase